jgi:hypothetical protein
MSCSHHPSVSATISLHTAIHNTEKEQSENYLSGITQGMFACEVITLLKPFFPRRFGVSHQNFPSSINQL